MVWGFIGFMVIGITALGFRVFRHLVLLEALGLYGF